MGSISQLYALQSGSALSRIVLSDIRKLEIPYPELKKQQKIAKILTTADNLIEKTQALIDKYTAIKQGMMADLFTRGIDLSGTSDTNPNHGQLRPSVEQAPELYKQTELGWVPKEWEVRRVEDVARVIDSLHQTPIFSEHGYPMVRVTDIKGGPISFERCARVSGEVFNKFTHLYEPAQGDIVLSRVGSYGISSYSSKDEKFCMGQNTVVITSSDNLNYLYQVFQTPCARNQFDLSVAGSSQKSLSLKSIKNTFIPIPTLTEQVGITGRLKGLNNKLVVETKLLNKLKEQKKGLMQDLLTGKVCVEV
jgi:type I restriction enzyme S subunit